VNGSGEGGYARALSGDETLAQQHALDEQVARFDRGDHHCRVPGRGLPSWSPRTR